MEPIRRTWEAAASPVRPIVGNQPFGPRRNWLARVLAGLLLASLGANAYLYFQLGHVKPAVPAPAPSTDDQAAALVSTVGRLMSLPADETPTVATVSDPTKLQDQPFFKNAMVGDKVLIYTKAKKAILYRPDENRVIEVASVNLDSAPTN